jgi:hypothetical protein
MTAPNFGEYAIIDGAEHQFEKEPDWTWTILPVNSGMELEMSKFLSHRRLVLGPDGKRYEHPPTNMEIAFREIALTFGGTTIPKDIEKPVAEGGEPILKAGASVQEVERVLASFPRAMFMELWQAVGQSYPYWGPEDPNAE